MASSVGKLARTGSAFSKWFQKNSQLNKYGLLLDDTLYESPEVVEAVRRLPQEIKDERLFRIIRAQMLKTNQRILPKEQWTKYEDDTPYLQPYLDEILKENKLREDWDQRP